MVMASAFVLFIASAIAAIGFLVMRNPTRLTMLAPIAEGYDQRIVLDRFHRNQMRMFGMILSFLGLMILTGVLMGLSHWPNLLVASPFDKYSCRVDQKRVRVSA